MALRVENVDGHTTSTLPFDRERVRAGVDGHDPQVVRVFRCSNDADIPGLVRIIPNADRGVRPVTLPQQDRHHQRCRDRGGVSHTHATEDKAGSEAASEPGGRTDDVPG